MENTTHYNLNKPELTDYAQISDLNDNADTIDGLIFDLAANLSNLAAETVKSVSIMNGILTVSYYNGTVSKFDLSATGSSSMDVTVTGNDIEFTLTVTDNDGNAVGTATEDTTLNITGVDSGNYTVSVETEGEVTFTVDGEETVNTSVSVTLLSEAVTVNVVISEPTKETETETESEDA